MDKHTYTETFLSDATVVKMINAIHQVAAQNRDKICVAIVDSRGALQGFFKMNHASFTSQTIAINKATTAAGLNLTTAELGKIMRDYSLPASHYGDDRITGFGGGLPIKFDDQLVGGIGVSGLTDDEDIYYAKIGIDAIA